MHEAERLATLRDFNILDSTPEKAFDDITLIAAEICNTPIALISLVDENRLWFKSKIGLEANQIPREHSFCTQAITSPTAVFEVPDTHLDPHFSKSPIVLNDPHIRFYAGIPLRVSDNLAIGTLCVADRKKGKLSEGQISALHALSRQVITQLKLRKENLVQQEASERLAEQVSEKEKVLHLAQQRYETLYQNSPVMMASIDPQTASIKQCNQTLLKALGYTWQEVSKLNIFDLYHVDCHASAKEAFRLFLETGTVEDKRLILRSKSGKKINVALNVNATYGENGAILYSNSVWRDISGLVQAEQQLQQTNRQLTLKVEERTRELTEAQHFLTKVTAMAPSIIYVFNQETMSNEYANREIGSTLGYSQSEIKELGAEMMNQLCHPDDLGSVYEHFGNIKQLQDGDTVYLEYRMKHKDGSYRWLLSVDAIFERDEEGNPIKHLGLATDITELREIQHKQALLAKDLESKNKELKQMAYIATHDLKVPIINIEGHFSFLKEMLPQNNADAQESIGFVEESIRQFQNTIAGLNHLFRLQSTETVLEEVNLQEIIQELIPNFSPSLEALEGHLTTDIEPDANVLGSRIFIWSIFQNLIENAIKYSDQNRKPEISIVGRDAGNCYRVELEDNGIGIDLELNRNKLFGMFKRFHDHVEGTGMGLHMTKIMIENSGGTIDLESSVGEGTKFIMQFQKGKG